VIAGLGVRGYPHVLAAALCVGVATANLVRPGWIVGLLAVAAALCGAGASSPTVRAAAVLTSLCLAGLWWGAARLDALDRSALIPRVGATERALVVVTGPTRRGRFSLRVPGEARRFGRVRLREPVVLRLPLGRAPPQGAELDLIATAERPRPAFGDFDERTWLRRHGVHVILRAERWRIVGRRGGLGGVSDRIRARLARSMAPGLRGERRAVLAGIVLGDEAGLSEELRERFRASGLYHLLAVSGQNVAIVAGGVLLCAWLLGVPRWLGEVGALAAIVGYVLAVGAQPSVVRAGIAGGLASLAWLAARERDRWHFLLLGALALLAWNPYVLLDPGFQLSFSAVAAIFLLVPRVLGLLDGYPVPEPLAVVLAVSAACGAVTAPIVWLQFHAVPVLTVPANALAAPAVAPVLGLALAAAAVDPVSPSAAAALAWANGWCAAYLAACARLVGGLPFAQVTSTAAMIALLALAGAGGVLVALRGRVRRGAVAAALLVAVLAGGWKLRPVDAPLPPKGLRITFLDVGQGDATLLEVVQGAVLVDQGPPEAHVAGQLRRLGVRRLAALVLTHPSRDNIGGAEEIVRELDVDLVLEPRLPFDNPFGAPALAEARRRGVRVLVTRAGTRLAVGRLELRVLWPDGSARPSDDPNDHATVLLASYGDVDALLPADAESNVTLRLRPPPVELLKVAHHGSADAGLAELVDRTRPLVAVISAGVGNEYGHPRPSTLAALNDAPGLEVFRTDRDGRIVVETDGVRIEVREER
jgi:competence protein ComEC